MAQIQAGTIYADGAQVTATNLNAHVNNAVLLSGAISEQTAVASCTGADSLLLLQSNQIRRGTISQVQAAIAPDLTPYINKNGSVAMTNELTLSSASPSALLSAAPKQYVDTGLATKQASLGFTPVNKAGDTGIGSLALSGGSTLTLAVDPAAALQAATKQYVDTGLATKQASLGFTPINKAGDTGIGSLTIGAGNTLTLAADPAQPLQASTKAYVDTQVATRVPTGGATLTGAYVFSNALQTPTAATVGNDVINKTYADNLIASLPNFSASAYFYTALFESAVVNPVTFLTVTGSRTAGSSTLTINYSSLAARYYDPTKPFFLQNQYIGLNTGVAGITGRLYPIVSANLAARTFTITTPETTAFSGSLQLTLVYDSTNLATNQYGQNVKSIYIDMTCVSKMYVNYIADIFTKSTTLGIPNTVRCVNISGNANGYVVHQLICIPMRDIGRTIYNFNQDVAEGFGATSLGCHIGFFYNNSNGSDYSAYYAASFTIMSVPVPSVII